MLILFMVHALADAMLMFRIPIPVAAWFAAAVRVVFGAFETAINEHSVNPEHIKFNESLILGRQIIHILPEGSAVLNPDKEAFCIDGTRMEARLPITINATNPIAMELQRTDLVSDANEIVHISKSQIKTMHREASRLLSYSEKPNEPKTLYYAVKKPGLYVLSKVVDESNLEVARKRLAHTVVVPCPKAEVKQSKQDRCRGELSNVEIEVTGTPPLTLKYRKVVNRVSQDATFESILPEDFSSPLARQGQNALVVPHTVDTAWARPQKVSVPLSESLDKAGRWSYSIDEVRDAFGNTVSYGARQHEDQERHMARAPHLHQVMMVHERPTVNLKGCSPQHPLKIAKNKDALLPVQYGSTGRVELTDTPHHLEWTFLPQNDMSNEGENTSLVKAHRGTMKDTKQLPKIKDAGLYTITKVSTDFCSGEVLEPASCLLQNPPEPQLQINEEPMIDKCAGSPYGLRVDLDLIGTPPFDIAYKVSRAGQSHHSMEHERVNGLRGQIELTPQHAGHYKYEFNSISDAVYKNHPLQGLTLEQDVKPSASARFKSAAKSKVICIDDTASFDVELQGEPPFAIEYELVHNNKRDKYSVDNIKGHKIEISTKPLTAGGDYTLALASVTDGMGCKEFMKDEAKVNVRHQKPKVGFRSIDGSRSISALEGSKVNMPLRLEGDGPWTVQYKDEDGSDYRLSVHNANDRITVQSRGKYTLTSVRDATCPGIIDDKADEFEISWIRRPEMRIATEDAVERKGNALVKASVCEGDDDSVEILFKGSAPYQASYVQEFKPLRGASAPQNKELKSGTNVALLRMDTRQAGSYTYKFNKLADDNYDHSSAFKPLIIQQQVNARPSAAFASPGKSYSFCSVESGGEEVIPINLAGIAPFDLEVEIKHHGSARPETISLTGLTGPTYNLRIPHSRLHLGKSAVHLRRVSDSNGCIRSLDSSHPRVQISVHDAPSITALEAQTDFCVGDRINFGLSGIAPFNVFYTFEGSARKAVATSTTFRRLAEKPGTFVITSIQDSALAQCKSATNITKHIHGMPSVRVSKGRDSYVDIHEGGSTEILFEFGGVPPFEFTYTRSSNTEKGGKKAGVVLDMKSEVSEEHAMRVRASEEGTYEVVAIKDRYCAYSKPGVKVDLKEAQRRLTY
jgi:nucleoporin POM152